MREYELIKNLFGDTKDLFKSDAQLIEISGENWGITCDDFSLTEDLFTDKDPYLLGSNLVVATLSDLYATGCTPSFYEHSIVFPKNRNYKWCEGLADGIKDILRQVGCILVGGDTGRGNELRYTGIALGKQERKISRIFPKIVQNLYVTGNLGDANEAIVKFKPTPRFELRTLPECALSAIDTSGGFVDALWILHKLNQDFKIEIENPPCNDINYLFGGAGEYELLFTTNEKCSDAIKIGRVIPNDKGVFINGVELTTAPPDPRAYKFMPFYILDVIKSAKRFKL